MTWWYRNKTQLEIMRDQLINLFQKALEKLNPYDAVSAVFGDGIIKIAENPIPVPNVDRVYVLALGKASLEMARAVSDRCKVKASQVLAVVPAGSAEKQPWGCVTEADHPVPGKNSEDAGRKILQFVKSIPNGSLLICCLSGGTSAMVTVPAEGITLEDLNKTHKLLLNSGANIYQMNAVRKHLSGIKGGQLLRALPAGVSLVDLVISDVPGNDLSVIGSGPTTPDPSSFADARNILTEFGLWERVPVSVRKHLKRGHAGKCPETLKPGEDPLKQHHTLIVASAGMLADRVAEVEVEVEVEVEAEVKVEVAGEPYTGDVETVASEIAQKVKEMADSNENPHLLVYYGESKVTVTGKGKGGRNQELALRGALKIAGHPNITWLSAGTDGIDGPTDAAGAVVDGSTVEEARRKGLDPEVFLERNDSYHFHEQMGTLLKTGPTGNNLMDLTLVLVD